MFSMLHRKLRQRKIRRDIGKIRKSHLFDPDWYRNRYDDVHQAGIDPAVHYYIAGASEGRDPGPAFETLRYIAAFPGAAGTNALLHCINQGNERLFLSLRFLSPSVVPAGVGATGTHKPEGRRDALEAWQIYNAATPRRAETIRKALADRAGQLSSFSIVMPVYNPPLYALAEAVDSVRHQSYQDWELLIVDDCSTDPEILQYLRSLENIDKRIKVKYRSANGHISAATNDASELATNEYITFLDNDDKLAPDALSVLALYISKNKNTDVFYSDDAVLSEKNSYKAAKFKAGWSPELLLSFCYISHLKGMKLSLYREIGGCRLGYEGSQDHDLFLRATELAEHVLHIPHVLYERRPVPGSTAVSGNAKPYSFDAGIRAVSDAFQRRNVPCNVRRPDWAVRGGMGIYEPEFPHEGPSVAIIIPTFNSWRLLDRLLTSMKATKYQNYNIYIADNESTDAGTLAFLSEVSDRVSVNRVSKKNGKFNFANINNVMSRLLTEDYLLFLNDDTEITQGNWLSQMVGWAQLKGVGVVGARLLFGDGRIQHGGISIAGPLLDGLTLFRGLPSNKGAYIDPRVARNVVAVTAACMLTNRRLFEELGGFDETKFAVAYNDVDYCLRVQEAGYRCVYAGEATLLHHEGSTRGRRDTIYEVSAMRDSLRHRTDPYINPQLQLSSGLPGVKPTVIPLAPENPVSLLAATHNLNHEGAPNSQAEVVIGLAKSGRVKPVVVSPRDGPLRHKYEAAGISVLILDDHPLSQGPSLTPEIFHKRLERQLANLKVAEFDVVYANTAQAFWAIHLAKMAEVPSVWNIRESEPWATYYDNFQAPMRELALTTFAIPYRVVFVANSTRRAWSPLDKMGNFTTIQNALPLGCRGRPGNARVLARQRLGIDHDQVMILNVGTICDRKNQREMIEGIDLVPEFQRSRCVIYLVGARPGEYLNSLNELIASKSWREQVIVVPETGDTADFWSAADVFCFTSKLESYPRVILEAMSENLPIVTTPVFGVAEQVSEGHNALLYPVGDIEKLASNLTMIIADSALRRHMADTSSAVLRTLNTHGELLTSYAAIFRAARESSIPGSPV